MQASRSTIRAVGFSSENTACGQTVTHMPQPLHFSLSSLSVTTLDKYRKRAIADVF